MLQLLTGGCTTKRTKIKGNIGDIDDKNKERHCKIANTSGMFPFITTFSSLQQGWLPTEVFVHFKILCIH